MSSKQTTDKNIWVVLTLVFFGRILLVVSSFLTAPAIFLTGHFSDTVMRGLSMMAIGIILINLAVLTSNPPRKFLGAIASCFLIILLFGSLGIFRTITYHYYVAENKPPISDHQWIVFFINIAVLVPLVSFLIIQSKKMKRQKEEIGEKEKVVSPAH